MPRFPRSRGKPGIGLFPNQQPLPLRCPQEMSLCRCLARCPTLLPLTPSSAPRRRSPPCANSTGKHFHIGAKPGCQRPSGGKGTPISDFPWKMITSQPVRVRVSPTANKTWETKPAFSSAVPLQSSLELLRCTEILILSELRHCRAKMSQKKISPSQRIFPIFS